MTDKPKHKSKHIKLTSHPGAGSEAHPHPLGSPAIVMIWTEPSRVNATIGNEISVRAKSLDTVANITDITFTSRWIVNLDSSGMMLRAMTYGETTLHVGHGTKRAVVPVADFK
jgi:hypothetical protein